MVYMGELFIIIIIIKKKKVLERPEVDADISEAGWNSSP